MEFEKLTQTAKFVVGASAVAVGMAFCALAVQSVGLIRKKTSSAGKKTQKKSKKKTKKKKKKKKKKVEAADIELMLAIEQACMQEFKQHLPRIGQQQEAMMKQIQASGVQLTPSVHQQVQNKLIEAMTKHLQATKAQLCAKHGVSEADHDALVSQLHKEEDPQVMELIEQSQALWNLFNLTERSEVPEHMTEARSIEYITQSFELVKEAIVEARNEFSTPEGFAEFQKQMKADASLAKQFNDKFRGILDVRKKALLAEYGLESEQVVSALITKYQGRPEFNAQVLEAKAKLDKFLQPSPAGPTTTATIDEPVAPP